MVLLFSDSEPHPQNPLLPFAQSGEDLLSLFRQTGMDGCLLKGEHNSVLHPILSTLFPPPPPRGRPAPPALYLICSEFFFFKGGGAFLFVVLNEGKGGSLPSGG